MIMTEVIMLILIKIVVIRQADNHHYCIFFLARFTVMIIMITIRVISITVTRMIIIDVLQSYGLKVLSETLKD